ncbi:Cupredoxin [Xylariaceae sp. FL0594]|nr:Cupredoxin [Xylariaceae sp. FL0594]
MKCLATLSLAMAPLAMSKVIQNTYPVEARNSKPGDPLFALGGGNAVSVAAGTTEIILVWVNPGNKAATTTLNPASTVTQTITAGASDTVVGTATVPAGATSVVAGTGATHSVVVGGAGGLTYQPSEVQAAVGDMVVFTFMAANHTVTQSSFDTPCDRMPDGWDSGFQPNKDNAVVPPPQVAIQVMDTKPKWFYCAQAGHCGKGMVFSINPTAVKTQALFQSLAIEQKGQGAGSALTGGNATVSAGAGQQSQSSAAAPPPTGVANGGAASETAAASGAIQTGTGTVVDGACVCAVVCAPGSFPDVNAQGVGKFGGFPGSMPLNLAEAI